MPNLGQVILGKTAALVILIIIYVNLCDYLLSQSAGGNNPHLYIDLHLYLYNCILFCIFSCFYWGREKFNKFDCILALCMFICLCKFKIIQYILKYKYICICILSYYTYSGTEYSDSLFDHNTWVLYCLFSCFSHLHLPWGCFIHPKGGILKLSTQ